MKGIVIEHIFRSFASHTFITVFGSISLLGGGCRKSQDSADGYQRALQASNIVAIAIEEYHRKGGSGAVETDVFPDDNGGWVVFVWPTPRTPDAYRIVRISREGKVEDNAAGAFK